jgi:hypothetical protein
MLIDEADVLGAGGEGRVYGVTGAPPLAAKLYDAADRPEREAKLRSMLANTPAQPSQSGHSAIAWPLDLLLDGPGGPAVGYLMRRVWNARVIDDYYNPQARLEHCPLFHYEYLMVTARNLAAAMRSLHSRSTVVGDVKQSNILVTPNALVTLVDTDSFQAFDEQTGTTHRCPVGSPEYTPPELQGLSSPGLLLPEHDLFGLGALIFQLLMEGAHPFAGVYTGDGDPAPIGERIRHGWFPHDAVAIAAATTFRRQSGWDLPIAPFVPSRKSLPFGVLPAELQELFLRCFVTGRHAPARRPSAREWQEALDRARASLVQCAANAQHRYGAHLPACPWCERAATILRGHDPFPSTREAVRTFQPVVPPLWAGGPAAPGSWQAPPLQPLGRPAPSSVPASWYVTSPPLRSFGKPQTGWFAYAIAALGLPIALGMFSAREAERNRDAQPTPVFAESSSQPSAEAAPAVEAPTAPAPAAPSAPAAATDASGAREALSRTGRYAAILVDSTTAGLVDCRTGRVIGTIQPSERRAPIDSVAVSETGMLAAADRYGVAVLDPAAGSMRSLLKDVGSVRSLSFSPDGSVLAVAADQGTTLVWTVDVKTATLLRSYDGNYGEMVASVRYSPDGGQLYASTVGSSNQGATIYCWIVATGRLDWRLSKRSWSTHFAISPNGRTLGVGGWMLDLRDASNGDQQNSQMGYSDQIPDADPLCWSSDGKRIAADRPDSLTVWRLDGRDAYSFPLDAQAVDAAAFTKDGTLLTTLSPTRGLEQWDVQSRCRAASHNLRSPLRQLPAR